jgi:hypothetical protein
MMLGRQCGFEWEDSDSESKVIGASNLPIPVRYCSVTDARELVEWRYTTIYCVDRTGMSKLSMLWAVFAMFNVLNIYRMDDRVARASKQSRAEGLLILFSP